METDFVNFPQKSESQDKSSDEAAAGRDSLSTKDRKTQNELKKQDMEATVEKTKSPPQPCGTYASPPADGVVEPNMQGLSNVAYNDPNDDQAQEWPPVPEPEEETQSERNEGQNRMKEISETSGEILPALHNVESAAHDNVTQVDEDSSNMASNEEIVSVASHDDSDSVVFISENSEKQNTDCKPLPTTDEFSVTSQNNQQEEREIKNPSNQNGNKVMQQVRADAPPLDTVAGEAANPGQGSLACSSTDIKEPLVMIEGRRDGERESRERGETGKERKHTVCFTETGEPEAEDQRQEEENKEDSVGEVSRMDGVDHCNDSQSDSGVSADFSPNSTTDVSDGPANTAAPQLSESPPNETPIEREIRLAVRREQSLRRSRGLNDTTNRTNEFVEIPVRRPILSQEVQFKPIQSKDRQFAGKKMQMEISAETEREKVLVELGRLPGFYDKGTEVQIQEKKLLFEAFQEPKASVPTLTGRSNSNEECPAGIQDVPAAEIRMLAVAGPGGPNSNSARSTRGPKLTEGTTTQIIIIETSPLPTAVRDSNGSKRPQNSASWTDGGSKSVVNSVSMRSSAEPVRRRQNLEGTEDKDDADLSLMKENPFFKLRSSMSLQPQVEQDIKEAEEREKELRRQRSSLYGGSALEPETGRIKEVDSRIREREKVERKVKEETTSANKEILRPTAQQTKLTSAAHQSEMFPNNTSGRQSAGKLDLTWPPPRDEEPKQQLEKTLRSPRQRNPLLDRWESGMVNGHVNE